MKTQNTQQQIDSIKAALDKMRIRLFEEKSSCPKYDAQRNLSGLTHYYDDETLRWHKSRVLSSSTLFGGLFHASITSDGLEMHGSKRGFRYVVHDVFGTCVSRPKLEECFSTRCQAVKAFESLEIDILAHFKAAIASICQDKANELNQAQQALSILA